MAKNALITRAVHVSLTLAVCTPGFAVMIVQGYDPPRHDRFGANFIGDSANTGFTNDLDFSGVGRSLGGRWGTLVSGANFLSARHLPPSGSLTFQDNSGTSATCTIIGGAAVGDTDIWVGAIDPLSCDLTGITPYAIATSGSVGTAVFQAGVTNATVMRVGRNVISQITPSDTSAINRVGAFANYLDDSAAGDLFLSDGQTATANDFNPDETYLQSGDSGGPSFVADSTGNMQLIGIHAYNGTTSDANFDGTPDEVDGMGDPIQVRRLSGDSYLPSHIPEINAVIAIVPEPSPVMLIGLVAALCVCGGIVRKLTGTRVQR